MLEGFYPVKEVNFDDGTTAYIPQHQIKDYNIRVVRSGNVLEIYQYENKVYYNYNQPNKQTHDRDKPENWGGKYDYNLTRARREIRRVVWSNWNKYSKFLTLTYADNMQDRKQFLKDFKDFNKTMSRRGYPLRYIYVLEYQKRGAIHCHMVLFNPEYIDIRILENAWPHGFVKINCINDVHNLGAYVCKYLTKESLAEYNSRSYSTSKGLNRSIERKITVKEGDNLIQQLLKSGEVVFKTSYNVLVEDIITNEVTYSQIKVDDDLCLQGSSQTDN